jgi:hypothetical protein
MPTDPRHPRHLTTDEIILFVTASEQFPAARRREIKEALAVCEQCRVEYEVERDSEADLLEYAPLSAWEKPYFEPEAYAALRSYARRVARENREARNLLRKVIRNPVSAARRKWAALPASRTLGVVRILVRAARTASNRNPVFALLLADMAVSVAESVPRSDYPRHAVDRARGNAWRERANAQLALSQAAQTLESLRRADRAFARVPGNEKELAQSALVRAGVLRLQGSAEEARTLEERANAVIHRHSAIKPNGTPPLQAPSDEELTMK